MSANSFAAIRPWLHSLCARCVPCARQNNSSCPLRTLCEIKNTKKTKVITFRHRFRYANFDINTILYTQRYTSILISFARYMTVWR